MVVLNVNGNSMFDVYKMKLLDVAKAIKPGPDENEVVDQSQQKDNSFDDFEDVNDDMLATVYQLVAQYEKMGGKLRTDGAKMLKGGAIGDDESYKVDSELTPDEMIYDLTALKNSFEKMDEKTPDFWDERLEYYKKFKTTVDNNGVKKAVNSVIKVIEQKTIVNALEFINALPDNAKEEKPATEEKKEEKKTNVVVPSNSLEKEFKIKLGNSSSDVKKVIGELNKRLKSYEEKTEDSNFWKAEKLKMEALYEIEKNDTTKSLKRPRTGVSEVFDRIQTYLDNKISLSMQSEQSQQQTAEAESKAEQAESKVEETEKELNVAKSLFNETGNTSLSSLLSLIVKVINKMIRLVKLKRDEWRSSVPTQDLKTVRDKVVEYFNKFQQINPNDKIMKSYKDSYKLTNGKFNELHDEFEMLVKTSNLNTQIYGGCHRCKFKDEDEPFKFPGKL
jgi:hypothetical protein